MKRKKKIDKRKAMVRGVAVAMAALMLISTFSIIFSMRSYAVPSSTKTNAEFDDFVLEDYSLAPGVSASVDGETLTNPDETTTRGKIDPGEPNTDVYELPTEDPETTTEKATQPETTIEKPTQKPSKPVKKDKYTASFALYGITKAKEVTVIIEQNNKSLKKDTYKLEFNKKNNYFVSVDLPVGEYTVKKIKTNSRYIDVTIDYEKFNIKENDMQNFSITSVEDEANFFVQFLGRNWIWLILLIGLSIALLAIQKKKEM